MSAQPHYPQSPIMPHLVWDNTETQATLELQSLQNRISILETQLERAIAHSQKKEAYANTLASDLEHIISHLQRLEIAK